VNTVIHKSGNSCPAEGLFAFTEDLFYSNNDCDDGDDDSDDYDDK
jgi:hypothetical protein